MSQTRDAGLYRRLERSFFVRGVALVLPAILPAACSATRPAGSGGNCCSEREWTTNAAQAKAYTTKDATDVLGCPSKIEGGTESSSAPPDAGVPPYGVLDLLEPQTKQLRASGDASSGEPACVYRSVTCCPGGRPLHDTSEDRRGIVASRTRGDRWSRKELAPLGTSLAPSERAEVARGWLEDALAEHASVASFARATLELLAVAAPPSLLAAHQRAGLQEIRHAERCFALARAYGDRAIDPGPIAIPLPRPGGLARLACDTFVEGCVAETIGALLAARALETCALAEPRAALVVIARDEAAHAALAWRTLAWALKEGGEDVVRAVLSRAAVARTELERPAPPQGPIAGLHAHGRLGDADVFQATHDAWHLVIDPLLAKLQRAG